MSNMSFLSYARRLFSYKSDNNNGLVVIQKINPIAGSKRPKSYRDTRGYLRFIDSDTLVHRYLAEKRLGRKLMAWEVVHHIDGNKCNNNPDNLLVCNWEDHDAIHRTNLLFYNTWHKPNGS
jgi:HNH endonuclease